MKSFLLFMSYCVGLIIVAGGCAIITANPLTTLWEDVFMRMGGLVVAVFGCAIMFSSLDDAY